MLDIVAEPGYPAVVMGFEAAHLAGAKYLNTVKGL